MRFDKLTTKFQQALQEAQSIAVGHDNQFIEPQHLLLALLEQEDGSTVSLLQRAGVNVAGLKSALQKAIEALQEMAAATSKVLRNGRVVTIKSEELVVGDIILLEAGDAVPADARMIESASVKVEEAALTGESVPVGKIIKALTLNNQKEVPLGDRKNMAYMGSTVAYGRGKAVWVMLCRC